MTEPFALEPLAQAILAADNLVVFEGVSPRQAHHFFDAEDRDALVRGAVAGAIRLRGKRSLLIQGEVTGTPVTPCRIEVGGDVLITGGTRYAHISARNIYIGGQIQDCRLSAAGDLQRSQAEVGAYQLGQGQVEGLRTQVDRARDERERLNRLVGQEEKRLGRTCNTTLVPLDFNTGRIVRAGGRSDHHRSQHFLPGPGPTARNQTGLSPRRILRQGRARPAGQNQSALPG